MNQKKVNRVIGKQDLRNLVKDSDGDGVSNVLDCKPYNPKQQGLIHKAGAAIARGLGARKTAERIEQRKVAVEAAKVEARTERAKQLKETAVFRERQRGIKQRAFIQRGGILGAAGRSFAQVAKPTPIRRLPTKAARQTLPTPKREKNPLSRMLGV